MLEGTWGDMVENLMMTEVWEHVGVFPCVHKPVFGPPGHTYFPPELEAPMLTPDGHYTPGTEQNTVNMFL